MDFCILTAEERFQALADDTLMRLGLTATYGTEFGEFAERAFTARGGHGVSAAFDPMLCDLTPETAFWVTCEDARGEIVHTQALKFIDLQSKSLSEYLTVNFTGFPPPQIELDWPRCRYRPGPGAMRMFGRVAYHGEFWLGGEPKQYRGIGLSSLLSRIGYWEAIKRWDPDHLFAFMGKPTAYSGLAERAGWMHTEPGALRWAPKNSDDVLEGFMAYLHDYDLHYLLDIPAKQPVKKAA